MKITSHFYLLGPDQSIHMSVVMSQIMCSNANLNLKHGFRDFLDK